MSSSYDPEERRETPLALKLKARIRADGPISVDEYMRCCLYDREHGYYTTQTAIGRSGDFITAPEISQIFGELVGLWCAVVWQQMGSPKEFNLIEFGPGRGTMMRDMMRATKIVPGFLDGARVYLKDISKPLRGVQRATLDQANARVEWIWSIVDVISKGTERGLAPRRGIPTIIVGNEYLDCLPPMQFVWTGGTLITRFVDIDDRDRLVFRIGNPSSPWPWNIPQIKRDLIDHIFSAKLGDVVEYGNHSWLGDFLNWQTCAALFIDYGHELPHAGDTLQAVRNHAYEHPLTSPGEADVTTQVDFTSVAREAIRKSMVAHGPVTQAEFLGRLGIAERASRLMAANPAKAAEIEAGVARLMAPNGMGTRFKAIGLRSRQLPPLPGF